MEGWILAMWHPSCFIFRSSNLKIDYLTSMSNKKMEQYSGEKIKVKKLLFLLALGMFLSIPYSVYAILLGSGELRVELELPL